MSKNIDLKSIDNFKKDVNQDPRLKVIRNAGVRNELTELTMDWDAFRKIDHSFSNIVEGEMPATNQKSSGRCWGFAGLNLFRIHLGRKYNLKDFQFSQSYFMFFDKLEKSNYFLDSILKTSKKDWNSRIITHLLSDPIEDGGQWDMWVNLVNKYGVVPQSEMSESYSSSKSARMNRMITRKLRENAKVLREESSKNISTDSLEILKKGMLKDIYKMLTIHLGTPPENFDWQTRDKDNNFIRFENETPQTFFKNHVDLNLDEYVCLINCPMSDKSYNKVYTVEHLGNVVEGKPIRYLNVTSLEMKEAAISSIKSNEPVWFGCDVGKFFHRDLGVMDTNLFDFNSFYGIDFGMNKADRLEYGDSQMTHAMLFTGVDLESEKKSKKWRVENSWGTKGGDKGYHIMTDSWFDEYNYEVVIHKSHIPEKLLKLYEESEAISLKPWDPMGALAK